MACTLAESLNDPLHRKLRQLRCLRRRFDCYRVERTSSRAGVAPAEVQRLSRRTFSRNYFGLQVGRLRFVEFTSLSPDISQVVKVEDHAFLIIDRTTAVLRQLYS